MGEILNSWLFGRNQNNPDAAVACDVRCALRKRMAMASILGEGVSVCRVADIRPPHQNLVS